MTIEWSLTSRFHLRARLLPFVRRGCAFKSFILDTPRIHGPSCRLKAVFRLTRKVGLVGSIENSNPPIVSREVFQAAQRLQKSRITTTRREHNSSLSGILRCSDCGSTFCRQLLRGTVYWMCSDKAAGAANCQSRPVRKTAVYDTFCLMADKLASHRPDLLGTLIHQMEMMQSVS